MSEEELWAIFELEAGEGLDRFAALLDRPSVDRGEGDSSFVEAAFRLMHNLKGAAALAGATAIKRLAHAVEDALAELRRERSSPSRQFVQRLRQATVLMRQALRREQLDDDLEKLLAGLREEAGTISAPRHASTGDERASARKASEAAPEVAEEEDADRGTVLRIEAQRLDRLLGFAGELLATHGRQRALFKRLVSFQEDLRQLQKAAAASERSALTTLTTKLEELLYAQNRELRRFGYVASDFGAALKRARMLPLRDMLPGWRRVVTETAAELGRRVRFAGDVGESEIDRQILDSLRDPMMHLLRNAVDHGIEPPGERERLGKEPTGTVTVRARSVGTRVELEVIDDGRGVDLEGVFRNAVAAGVVQAGDRGDMSDDAVAALMFKPGVSTATRVSRVSGRGVGLDVVYRRIWSLGGTTRYVPRDASGVSLFRLSVPVTLVSSRGLQVRTSRADYILPAASVARVFRVRSDEVTTLEGGAAVRREGEEPLRLRWLAALMGEHREPDPTVLPVVVVTSGHGEVGLVVRQVVGELEFVNKGLPWNVERLPGVVGAVILGDGSIAAVVDVLRLAGPGADTDSKEARSLVKPEARRKHQVLVADDSLTSRVLVQNILTTAGYEVVTVADGQIAWARLQAEDFDLLVSDVEMANCDGLELTRRVRASARHKHLPVILVTSLFQPEQVKLGAEAGADEYIIKGEFDQSVLLEAVSRLI